MNSEFPETPENANQVLLNSEDAEAVGSKAVWVLRWNVKGWLNGHCEEHDSLDTAIAQLQNIAADDTLEIELRREVK